VSAGTGGTPSTGGVSAGTGGVATGTGGVSPGTGGATGTGGVSPGTGGSLGTGGTGAGSPSFGEVSDWIDAYKAAHPGNGGKDWDINAKSPAEIAADPDAQRLLSLCGDGQRPVIPELAWEYGGGDHQWISPEASPLVICVYIPVQPSTEHWQHDAVSDNVTADAYVLFPDDNPCKDRQGADQIAGCIGDFTNFEILVDTASLNDGVDVGLDLSEASTDLMLLMPDGNRVLLVHNN
jgi:hypothetical protein